jgi:hypothetical protein
MVCCACATPAKAKMAAAATAFKVERLFMNVSSWGLKIEPMWDGSGLEKQGHAHKRIGTCEI